MNLAPFTAPEGTLCVYSFNYATAQFKGFIPNDVDTIRNFQKNHVNPVLVRPDFIGKSVPTVEALKNFVPVYPTFATLN